MEIAVGCLLVLTAINTFLTIGIAGSVVRLIKSLTEEEGQQPVTRRGWSKIVKERRAAEIPNRSRNYADSVIENSSETTPGIHWDGMSPRRKNWDGVPSSPEE